MGVIPRPLQVRYGDVRRHRHRCSPLTLDGLTGQQYRGDARLFPSRWPAADFRSSIDEVAERSGYLIVGFVAVPPDVGRSSNTAVVVDDCVDDALAFGVRPGEDDELVVVGYRTDGPPQVCRLNELPRGARQ